MLSVDERENDCSFALFGRFWRFIVLYIYILQCVKIICLKRFRFKTCTRLCLKIIEFSFYCQKIHLSRFETHVNEMCACCEGR